MVSWNYVCHTSRVSGPREIGYVAEAKEVTLENFVCGHEDLWELEVVNLCCEVNFEW